MLITFEGIDGSGKGTQAALLRDHFALKGFRVESFSFPQYGHNPFANAVGDYLNGEGESAFPVSPRCISLLYACDRSTASSQLRDLLANGHIVICDRYVESNLAHQMPRVPASERLALREWIIGVEYGEFKLPQPDRIILLDLPVMLAQARISRKRRRSYTTLTSDIHEADAEYLTRTRQAYLEMAHNDPDRWVVISSVDAQGGELSPADVGEVCENAVRQLLA